MNKLIKDCIEFFVNNIEEMARLHVDMSCISSAIVRKIAKVLKIDKLDILKERKDKLVSRLFMKKLE